MMEPIDVALGRDGALYIGDIRYLNGEPVSSRPVEMTSQGAHINGLDAKKWISAGYACHLYGGKTQAYIAPIYDQREDVSAPVKNISRGTSVGFRYLQFGLNTPMTLTAVITADTGVNVSVRLDAPGGREIARIEEANGEVTVPLNGGITGKHAVYFVFEMAEGKAEMDRFTFDD